MRRKQMGEEMTEEAIVNRIYEELKSRSFVEQLRLECIIDVKKKETYMQLQNRMEEYLTKKMPSNYWMDDNFNTDVFRGQVVECGVLAITVERIVDAVVTRKLHEELKLMITKMVTDFLKAKFSSKVKQSRVTKRTSRSPPNGKCSEESASFVKKICEDTQRDSKMLFEGSFICKSLAHVFNSDSQEDSDDEISEISLNETNNSPKDEPNTSNKRKRKNNFTPKKDDAGCEQIVRVKRERKFNPKYSPTLYQTSKVSCSALNGHTPPLSPSSRNVDALETQNSVQKTPVSKSRSSTEIRSSTPNSVKSASKNITKSFNQMLEIKGSKIKKEVGSIDQPAGDNHIYFAKKSAPKPVGENATKTSPTNRKHPIPMEPHPKLSVVEDASNNVRKSGRPRKLNSKIFSDTFQGVSALMDKVLASNLSPGAAEAKSAVKNELEGAEKSDSSLNLDSKPEVHSSKRYDESDLYKPRPVINSSGSRSRRA